MRYEALREGGRDGVKTTRKQHFIISSFHELDPPGSEVLG